MFLVLESILTSEQQPGEPIHPIQWYYEHTTVIPIWTSEYLVYKTQLPVVLPARWHYVEIRQWPMPLQEFQGRVLLPEAVLRNTETGDIDITPRCFGHRPRVCRRGLINHAGIHPCITRLLAEVPTYDPQCVVMFEKRLPLDRVHSLEQNKYILITDGTELALRCAGRSEQIAVVKAGVYEITLRTPCSLHSQTWKLLPIYQRTINLTLAPRDIRFEVNISIADLFQEHLKHDPLIFGLAEMEAVDRKQIEMSALLQPIAVTSLGSWKKHFWHMFWLVLIGAPVAGVVYGWRRHGRHRSAESPIGLELKQITSTNEPKTPPPSPSPDKQVFTFVGRKN